MELRKDYVYLDHNATSVIRPEVCSRMLASYQLPYNASSIHSLGQAAKAFLGEARVILSQHIECSEDNIVFTSGGTESNNIVLQSAWDQIFCSSTEHDSIYKGAISQVIPVFSSGIVDIEALERLLKSKGDKRTLVSIHWANNETGVIQPVHEIATMVHRYGAWIHVDGVQILGKIPFSFQETGIDFLSLSAHKMGGPQGVGALVTKKDTPLVPLFFGGGQERFLRAGTENVAGVIGFGEAIRVIDFAVFNKLEVHHRFLEKELCEFSQSYGKPLSVMGKDVSRLPNTTCLTMPGVSNQSQLIYFDLKGIGVSIGSACSSRSVKPSRILKNMGFSEELVGSAIRLSSGWNTRESDFVKFKEAWKELFLNHIQKM